MKSYEGKVCVVTGAASGIGRAVAIKLGTAGALLALSDVNEDGLAETAKLAGGAASNRILIDRVDMADRDQIEAYAGRVQQALGDADYVFNIAGFTRIGSFENTPMDSFESVMDVNFYGVVRMCKAFLPQVQKTKGALCNISSLFGLLGYAGQTHYCASKFAVRGFSETLAQELEGSGVTVTCVHPGGVKTNVARNAVADKLPDTGVTREEMDAQFDELAITTPEKAAQIILDGTAKGKRRIVVGKDAKIASFIQRLFPVAYPKILAKYTGDKLALRE